MPSPFTRCRLCGAEVDLWAKFCPRCGRPKPFANALGWIIFIVFAAVVAMLIARLSFPASM